jgi:hypothetical protein
MGKDVMGRADSLAHPALEVIFRHGSTFPVVARILFQALEVCFHHFFAFT